MNNSVLTKHQVKTFTKDNITINGEKWAKIVARVRYDDQCNNGHNTFIITGDFYANQGEIRRNDPSMGGCCHDEISKAFPELAHLIKWHSVSSNGPLYYVENTTYYTKENGVLKGWYYLIDPANNINKCLVYTGIDSEEAKKLVTTYGDKIVCKPDEKTAKIADLAAARSCAIWPDATIEQLRDKDQLLARLPALMAEFRTDIESAGFVY